MTPFTHSSVITTPMYLHSTAPAGRSTEQRTPQPLPGTLNTYRQGQDGYHVRSRCPPGTCSRRVTCLEQGPAQCKAVDGSHALNRAQHSARPCIRVMAHLQRVSDATRHHTVALQAYTATTTAHRQRQVTAPVSEPRTNGPVFVSGPTPYCNRASACQAGITTHHARSHPSRLRPLCVLLTLHSFVLPLQSLGHSMSPLTCVSMSRPSSL